MNPKVERINGSSLDHTASMNSLFIAAACFGPSAVGLLSCDHEMTGFPE